MQAKQFTNPFYFGILTLPYGISTGFVTVTLPYILTHKNFSVAATATIVSIGVSANVWRFLWGPIADITLSLKKWYWIGVAVCIASLLLLCYIPYNNKQISLLTAVVFISQVACTFVVLPLGGLMAHRIKEEKKGSAAGWYQAGNLGGVGLGGGAGLWLTTHYNVQVAGIVLSIAMIACALVIILVSDIKSNLQRKMIYEVKQMSKDVLVMLKTPIALFIMLLICMPIGTGAASNVWSSIAEDWHVTADTVALVTGVLSGVIGTIGCVAGGWIADKFGVWWAYLGSGTICALAAIGMAALPYNPNVYIAGVLAYGFSLGLINAAFSAIILYAIGKKSAATKYSLLSSLGNIPVVYMTNFDGWAHDNGGSKYMLIVEAAAGIGFVILCLIILKWMKNKNWILKPVDIEAA